MLRRIANIIIMTTLLIGPALLLNYASSMTNVSMDQAGEHLEWSTDSNTDYTALATPR